MNEWKKKKMIIVNMTKLKYFENISSKLFFNSYKKAI